MTCSGRNPFRPEQANLALANRKWNNDQRQTLNLHVSELIGREGWVIIGLKAGVDESLEKQDLRIVISQSEVERFLSFHRIEGMRHPSIKPHRTLIPCTTVREYVVVGSASLSSGRDQLLRSASI